MPKSFADRLRAARHDVFVGRHLELDFLEAPLGETELPFGVAYVCGPGGVGKTALLQEFAVRCKQRNLRVLGLDARNFDPTPAAFCAAYRLLSSETSPPSVSAFASDSTESTLPDTDAAQAPRTVLIIDTFELLQPLETWLREEFLPTLSDETFVVLAGRDVLSSGWRSDSGWQSLLRSVILANLSVADSTDYLGRRGVADDRHEAVLAWTRGHPLALCLAADLAAQGEHSLDPFLTSPATAGAASPGVLRILLERLVHEVPSARHRAALEVCALVRQTTESILAALVIPDSASHEATTGAALPEAIENLPREATSNGGTADVVSEISNTSAKEPASDAYTLFDWLRGLAFMQESATGIFPHDMAREVLLADLRWRDAERYDDLENRARAFYLARLGAGRREPQRVIFDYVFLHRRNPVLRPYLDWNADAEKDFGVARESEVAALVEIVRRHEGKASAQLAQFWLERELHSTLVLRDENRAIAGFVMNLPLHSLEEERGHDPAVRAAWDYLRNATPLRAGEGATHFRFWMAAETYQDVSPVQSVLSISVVRHCLTTPALAFSFLPCADAPFWQEAFSYLGVARLSEADYQIGKRQYGVYGHDWRVVRPMEWLEWLAAGESGGVAQSPRQETSATAQTQASHCAASRAVLTREEFASAIHTALRDLARPTALQNSVLLHSRMVSDNLGSRATSAERVTVLQRLVRDACASLENSPRDAKAYHALLYTYLQPAPTQEQAAVRMDVPFSTYRRHLKAGIGAVVAFLWSREIGG